MRARLLTLWLCLMSAAFAVAFIGAQQGGSSGGSLVVRAALAEASMPAPLVETDVRPRDLAERSAADAKDASARNAASKRSAPARELALTSEPLSYGVGAARTSDESRAVSFRDASESRLPHRRESSLPDSRGPPTSARL